MISFTTFALTFLALVTAAPFHVRDVFVPPVLTPGVGTVWIIGSRQNVTWDVSHPPAQITNKVGKIVLAKGGRLDFEHPLAVGFDILTGRHEVTVPAVAPDSDYQIIVFGDSGNSGGTFTIKY